MYIAVRNPFAYLLGNLSLRRTMRAFSPTHIHLFNPFYAAAFYETLRSTSIPIVYRAGDAPTVHNVFWRAMWRFIRRRAKHFVADSHFIKGELMASGVDAARITVLYAPPPQRVQPPAVEIPPAADRTGVARFVYVGQLTAAKGVDVLLEAFRRLQTPEPRPHLLIAGRISDWSGDDWARTLRDRALADPEIGDRVHFLGLVENAPELIRRCDVHIAPSIREEAYGLVVVEAKSAARPSIIFRNGGMTELVEDGVDGAVLSEKTTESLALAMRLYAERPELVEIHGHAALVSMQKLGLTSFARSWKEIYEGASA